MAVMVVRIDEDAGRKAHAEREEQGEPGSFGEVALDRGLHG
jgi:hypothetical protein